MDFAKTKSDIYKQQGLLSKIRWVTFFTSVIQFKKNKKIWFWPKMTDYEFFGEKSSTLGPFLTSKGYKRAYEFLAGIFFFFLIGQCVYLQAHWTLNSYVRYLGKILKFVKGREKRPFFPPPIFIIPIILKNF